MSKFKKLIHAIIRTRNGPSSRDRLNRDRQPRTLTEYLVNYLSLQQNNIGQIYAFSLSVCDDYFNEAGAPTTSLVTLFVDGGLDELIARRMLRDIDEGIDNALSRAHKPVRIAYKVQSDSDTLYQAMSKRIQGELPVRREENGENGGENEYHAVMTALDATPKMVRVLELDDGLGEVSVRRR